jgi:ribosome-binding factor A
MSSHRPSQKDIESLCSAAGPDDGIDPRYLRPGGGRAVGRKTLQLCGQVSRTLMEVLAGCADEVLRELEVVSVAPAAGVGRLLLTLRPGPAASPRDPALIGRHVAGAEGLLRREVAAAIHRRKAPELVWQVVRRTE